MDCENSDKRLTFSWMGSLIKAQAVLEAGVRLSVRQETLLRGEGAACRKRCSGCCEHPSGRATELEVAGALWHLLDARPAGAHGVLERLESGGGAACPFLHEGACTVYPMRFLSCRQLVVFGKPCASGEDPLRTRRGDVLTLLRRHALKGYALLLPHLGVQVAGDPLELEAQVLANTSPLAGLRVARPEELPARMDRRAKPGAREAA